MHLYAVYDTVLHSDCFQWVMTAKKMCVCIHDQLCVCVCVCVHVLSPIHGLTRGVGSNKMGGGDGGGIQTGHGDQVGWGQPHLLLAANIYTREVWRHAPPEIFWDLWN